MVKPNIKILILVLVVLLVIGGGFFITYYYKHYKVEKFKYKFFIEEAEGHLAGGNYEIALEKFREVYRTNPNDTRVLNWIVRTIIAKELANYNLNLPPEAKELIEKSLKLDPKNPETYRILGYIKEQIEINCPEAIDYYKKSTELDPKYVDGYMGLAHSYDCLGDFPTAKQFYLKALEIDQNNPNAIWAYVSRVLAKEDRREEAISLLERINNLMIGNIKQIVQQYTLLASLYSAKSFESQEPKEKLNYRFKAIETLNIAENLDPSVDVIFTELGKQYSLLLSDCNSPKIKSQPDCSIDNLKKYYALAFNYLLESNKLNPLNSQNFFWLGEFFLASQNYTGAEKSFNEALSAIEKDTILWSPQDKERVRGLVYYELAKLKCITNNANDCFRYLDQAINLRPDLKEGVDIDPAFKLINNNKK